MKIFISAETERAVGERVTSIIRAVQLSLSEELLKGNLSNSVIYIRYVPIIMNLQPQFRKDKLPRLKRQEVIIDHAPQLEYSKFSEGSWSESLIEFLNGLRACENGISTLEGNREVAAAFLGALDLVALSLQSP